MTEQPEPSEPDILPKKPREFRTTDAECLSCGAFNIPENKICGACGASLPLIYDKDGHVFRWESDSPYWEALHPSKKKGLFGGPQSSTVILRVVAVLVLVLFALWLMSRGR